jgi:hypothetical protein
LQQDRLVSWGRIRCFDLLGHETTYDYDLS